jgi:hypothetical protein
VRGGSRRALLALATATGTDPSTTTMPRQSLTRLAPMLPRCPPHPLSPVLVLLPTMGASVARVQLRGTRSAVRSLCHARTMATAAAITLRLVKMGMEKEGAGRRHRVTRNTHARIKAAVSENGSCSGGGRSLEAPLSLSLPANAMLLVLVLQLAAVAAQARAARVPSRMSRRLPLAVHVLDTRVTHTTMRHG